MILASALNLMIVPPSYLLYIVSFLIHSILSEIKVFFNRKKKRVSPKAPGEKARSLRNTLTAYFREPKACINLCFSSAFYLFHKDQGIIGPDLPVFQMIQLNNGLYGGIKFLCDIPEGISRLYLVAYDPRHTA